MPPPTRRIRRSRSSSSRRRSPATACSWRVAARDADAALAGAEARERALLDRLGLSEMDAERFGALGAAILGARPVPRPDDLPRAEEYWRAEGFAIDASALRTPIGDRRTPVARAFVPATAGPAADRKAESLSFDIGYGGFTADGCEYVIRIGAERPPMPWVNVVANEAFGFLVSESGAGTTWSRNSRLNRLTPWS